MIHKRKWFGIPLACPKCKHSLIERENDLTCDSCGLVFPVTAGAAVMLIEETEEVNIKRRAVQDMFTAYNQSLEEQGLSRFSTFINWGYTSLVEVEGTRKNVVNEGSVSLLYEVIDNIDLSDRDVLEIACGRGGNMNAICKKFMPRNIVGLDLTESNIVFCHKNNRYEHAHFCVGDAEQLPFPSASYDIVLNIESSDLYPRITCFFDEVYRVLKLGGVFLYADDMPTEKFMECECYLQKLGFTTILNRDISANVVQSCQTALQTRLKTLHPSISENNDILESMGVPGTKIMEEMRDGKRKYKILQLLKQA